MPFTARNLLTRPTPSAPRRALVPSEHSFTVRGLRARRAPGRSLRILLRARVRHLMILPLLLALFLAGAAWIGPQLRTSNDHYNGSSELARTIPLRVARLVSNCARPTRAFRGRALREHRRPTGYPTLSIFLFFHSPTCEHHLPALR